MIKPFECCSHHGRLSEQIFFTDVFKTSIRVVFVLIYWSVGTVHFKSFSYFRMLLAG